MMRLLSTILCLLLSAAAASAASREDVALAQYEDFCITNALHLERLPDLMRKRKADALSRIASSVYLRQSGRVWRLTEGGERTSIFITDTGACGVMASNVDYDAVQRRFKERFPARLASREADEGQILTIYAARTAEAPTRADTRILALFLGGKRGAFGQVVMSVFPSALFEKAGLGKLWPNGF